MSFKNNSMCINNAEAKGSKAKNHLPSFLNSSQKSSRNAFKTDHKFLNAFTDCLANISNRSAIKSETNGNMFVQNKLEELYSYIRNMREERFQNEERTGFSQQLLTLLSTLTSEFDVSTLRASDIQDEETLQRILLETVISQIIVNCPIESDKTASQKNQNPGMRFQLQENAESLKNLFQAGNISMEKPESKTWLFTHSGSSGKTDHHRSWNLPAHLKTLKSINEALPLPQNINIRPAPVKILDSLVQFKQESEFLSRSAESPAKSGNESGKMKRLDISASYRNNKAPNEKTGLSVTKQTRQNEALQARSLLFSEKSAVDLTSFSDGDIPDHSVKRTEPERQTGLENKVYLRKQTGLPQETNMKGRNVFGKETDPKKQAGFAKELNFRELNVFTEEQGLDERSITDRPNGSAASQGTSKRAPAISMRNVPADFKASSFDHSKTNFEALEKLNQDIEQTGGEIRSGKTRSSLRFINSDETGPLTIKMNLDESGRLKAAVEISSKSAGNAVKEWSESLHRILYDRSSYSDQRNPKGMTVSRADNASIHSPSNQTSRFTNQNKTSDYGYAEQKSAAFSSKPEKSPSFSPPKSKFKAEQENPVRNVAGDSHAEQTDAKAAKRHPKPGASGEKFEFRNKILSENTSHNISSQVSDTETPRSPASGSEKESDSYPGMKKTDADSAGKGNTVPEQKADGREEKVNSPVVERAETSARRIARDITAAAGNEGDNAGKGNGMGNDDSHLNDGWRDRNHGEKYEKTAPSLETEKKVEKSSENSKSFEIPASGGTNENKIVMETSARTESIHPDTPAGVEVRESSQSFQTLYGKEGKSLYGETELKNLLNMIFKNARYLKKGDVHNLRVQLHPPELGRMSLRLIYRESGSMTINIKVETEEAEQKLEKMVPSLLGSLDIRSKNTEIRIDHVGENYEYYGEMDGDGNDDGEEAEKDESGSFDEDEFLTANDENEGDSKFSSAHPASRKGGIDNLHVKA